MEQHLKYPDTPPKKAIAEAKNNKGGYVYQIDGSFSNEEHVPPERIIGGWKVNSLGDITGDFVPNPNYISRENS